jgi:hypothetical protein
MAQSVVVPPPFLGYCRVRACTALLHMQYHAHACTHTPAALHCECDQ